MPRQTARRHQQGEDSRLRILNAAFEIASERGYDGTTLALVTKRSGLPASSVYWQFKNKDELLAEAIEHNYREWRAARTTWTELAAGEDLDVQVEIAMRHLAQGLITQPAFQRLGLMLALERRAEEATARARFRKVRDETVTMLTGWWRRVLPSPAISAHPQAPHQLAQLMIAVSDGLFIAVQTDDELRCRQPDRVAHSRDAWRGAQLSRRGTHDCPPGGTQGRRHSHEEGGRQEGSRQESRRDESSGQEGPDEGDNGRSAARHDAHLTRPSAADPCGPGELGDSPCSHHYRQRWFSSEPKPSHRPVPRGETDVHDRSPARAGGLAMTRSGRPAPHLRWTARRPISHSCCPASATHSAPGWSKRAGFIAAYATGAGIANSQFGLADIGLISLGEVVEQVGRITDATDRPVVVDARHRLRRSAVRDAHGPPARARRSRRCPTRGPADAQEVRAFRRSPARRHRRDGRANYAPHAVPAAVTATTRSCSSPAPTRVGCPGSTRHCGGATGTWMRAPTHCSSRRRKASTNSNGSALSSPGSRSSRTS